MALGKLPSKDTLGAQSVIARYLAGEGKALARELGYRNWDAFTRAMRHVYGVYISETRLEQTGTEQSGGRTNAPHEANVPLKIKEGVVAVINDTHNPYQDLVALGLVERFLTDLQPDFLFYAGDANDFYQISVFDKDPARISEMQSDIDNTRAMFRKHRVMLPNADIRLIGGNHEDRWQKFLWTKASALSSLNCLTIPELYHLKDYGIQYIPDGTGYLINGVFKVMHGDLISAYSAYTAKRMFEKHGHCGMHGHSHRGGSYYKTDDFGTWGWWENYCLCSLNPDWIKHPNWQHGISLVHFRNKRFWVEQIPIVGNSLMYGGKLYE